MGSDELGAEKLAAGQQPVPEDEGIPEDELVPEDDTIIGQAFKWSMLVIGLISVAVVVGLVLTREQAAAPEVIERGPIEAPERLVQDTAAMPAIVFTDITAEAGIDFVHTSGAMGEKLLPETMGAGAAFFDADGDGDQDLLLVNSSHWRESSSGPPPTMALYRNDGSGRFVEITEGSGLDVSFYGQGVAVGDYDNDGDSDLFLSALGTNHLFRNDGGTFKDVTGAAGLAGDAEAWSSSAGFFDSDNDGDLDLFVCTYVQWSEELDLQLNFTLNGVDRAYGPPKLYQGSHSYLYRNNGDGTFSDVSAESGIRVNNPATGQAMGKALAVTFVDVDASGYLDIFVANDTVQNFLFRNNGDGTFEEVGAMSGLAFDGMGSATGAMGMDAADFANDGTIGVGIGNFANESTSFYVQQPNAWQFVDMAAAEGIGSPSLLRLSFGLFFFDYDLDGRLDLLEANGHLEDEINTVQASMHYEQPAQLFWNAGPDHRSCFVEASSDTLGDLATPIVGRGATYADVDGDGDLDVLLTQTGRRPLLLRNDQQLGHHWVRIRLVGSACNPSAIGARVELEAGGVVQRRDVFRGKSYLAQVELALTFGLGATTLVDRVTVTWPDGSIGQFPELDVDRVHVLEQ